MDRSTKEKIVAELHEKLLRAKIAILADYRGIKVKELNELRGELRKSDSEVRVVKNNLLNLALKETKFTELEEHLEGPRALILNFGDVVAPAKALTEFAKKNAALEIKGGVLEGSALNKAELVALAELPSREVLLGKLLSLFVAVPTRFVTVLNGVPQGFVRVLDGYRLKKEETI
ncbi:MAG: 50S ribosomal protein L10 [Syntrophales bacterium]|nr:50S ribosomal protein L10 [Syntrophales bacterium]